jgi:purine-nucleoside phosphorylase
VTDAFELAGQTARALAAQSGVESHDVAVVLGSGWRPAADDLGETAVEVSTTDLPGFPPSTVAGHAGQIRSLQAADGRRVLAFLGRVHGYEGHEPTAVVHGVRTAHAAGCRVVVLTNAAGAIRPGLGVGQPVLVRDHLNLTGRSPLAGPEPPATVPSRFVDLTDAYSERLRTLVRSIDPTIEEGVYAALPGPHYETPAEIRMLRQLGADLVGMSTVWETIAARHLAMEVVGLSLVSNSAAGVTSEPLSHADVLEAGRSANERTSTLLTDLLARL